MALLGWLMLRQPSEFDIKRMFRGFLSSQASIPILLLIVLVLEPYQ